MPTKNVRKIERVLKTYGNRMRKKKTNGNRTLIKNVQISYVFLKHTEIERVQINVRKPYAY